MSRDAVAPLRDQLREAQVGRGLARETSKRLQEERDYANEQLQAEKQAGFTMKAWYQSAVKSWWDSFRGLEAERDAAERRVRELERIVADRVCEDGDATERWVASDG